jgi:hypothetical protein
MNQEIEKLNSLVTSLKMADAERTKLKEKAEIILHEEKILIEQHDIVTGELKKIDDEFAVFKAEHQKKIQGLKDELTALKEANKEKSDETALYFDIKTLKKEINRLTQHTEFLVTEIEDTKAGKITPGFSKHCQKRSRE